MEGKKLGKFFLVLAKMGQLGQKLKTFSYNFQIENQNPNLTKVRNCERNEAILKDHNFFIIDLFLMIFLCFGCILKKASLSLWTPRAKENPSL